jgi:hypothetical protein
VLLDGGAPIEELAHHGVKLGRRAESIDRRALFVAGEMIFHSVLGGQPVVELRDVDAIGVASVDRALVHHGCVLNGAQAVHVVVAVALVVALKAERLNDVRVAASAVGDVLYRSGLFAGLGHVRRHQVHAGVEQSLGCAFVVARRLKTSVREDYVTVATGAVASVGNVFRVVGAVNTAHGVGLFLGRR